MESAKGCIEVCWRRGGDLPFSVVLWRWVGVRWVERRPVSVCGECEELAQLGFVGWRGEEVAVGLSTGQGVGFRCAEGGGEASFSFIGAETRGLLDCEVASSGRS